MGEEVRSMERENNYLKKELNELIDNTRGNYNINTTTINSDVNEVEDVLRKNNNSNTTEMQTEKTWNKILVKGDDNVKELLRLLKTHTNNLYDIQSRCFKNNFLDELLESCLKFAKKFIANDYIVILWSSKNSLQGKGIDCKVLRRVISVCSKTNLIIIAPPYHEDRPILNRFIEDDSTAISILMAESQIQISTFLPR